MTEEQSSYRQIIKATSLFGGVQVFQIVIQVIRSKFVAVLLGPGGIGIMGLLTSTVELISRMTNFGLGTSAIKDIAAANSTGDEIRIATVANVLRRLVWITGILGSLIVLIFSPLLSQITFGNRDYTLAFIWISITLLFNQLSSGQLVILQGMRKLQYLAKANLSGSVTGLILTIPLFYIWGINGIVPSIIVTALITLTFSWYYSKKIKIQPVWASRNTVLTEGKSMLYLGFMISLSGLISIGTSYVVRIYISHTGGVGEVGLYNSGFAIINTYVGLVFTAMAKDYYPRLSAVAKSNKLCKQIINQQAEIAVLILAPILIIFIVFINWVIILLYSTRFIAVNGMIKWAALGVMFQAASWSLGYLLLAKGVGKMFFLNELTSKVYLLGLNLVGYYYWGLSGLGISFLISYIIYFFQVFWLSKLKFEFSFETEFKNIFGIQFMLVLASFFIVRFLHNPFNYVAGFILVISSSYYSYIELDKRVGLKALVISKFKK